MSHRTLTAAVRRALGAHTEVAVYPFDTIDSTNAEARRHVTREACPALFLSRAQSAGRGRLGRSFHSPADTGLYMTLAYTTDRPLSESTTVTALAAVATASTIEALTDKRPQIKWVNDLYLRGGKLAGILTEAVPLAHASPAPVGGNRHRILVGIGLNLTTTDFPDGLRAPATSLFSPEEAGMVTDAFLGTLAGEIARRLLELLTQSPHAETLPNGESCLAYYRRHLLYVGQRVTCARGNQSFEGFVRGVSSRYSLLVDVDGETVVLDSGELSVRPIG